MSWTRHPKRVVLLHFSTFHSINFKIFQPNRRVQSWIRSHMIARQILYQPWKYQLCSIINVDTVRIRLGKGKGGWGGGSGGGGSGTHKVYGENLHRAKKWNNFAYIWTTHNHLKFYEFIWIFGVMWLKHAWKPWWIGCVILCSDGLKSWYLALTERYCYENGLIWKLN